MDKVRKEIEDYTSGIREVFARLPVETIGKIIKVMLDAYENGGKVITMGNGGHGATASHCINDIAKHTIVSDKKNQVIVKGKRFKTLCLNDNVATLTSWANDVGYESIFAEQLANWVEKGDVVIGYTGSGNSENVLRAFKVAKENKATTIALTGYQGGKIKDIADICLIVPSDRISFIEDIHFSLIHIWCDSLRRIIKEKYGMRSKQ
ncbi:MAG: SIS domain-containing protein [Candidatus Omnitrophota bacterium]